MLVIWALVSPAVLWAIFRFTLPTGPYAMDQGRHRGSFFPLLILYNVFGYALLLLSMSMALIAYNHELAWAGLLFLVAGVEALVFNGWLLFTYERYMHATAVGVSNYTLNRYALTLSLGFSAVITCVVGFVLAVEGIATK